MDLLGYHTRFISIHHDWLNGQLGDFRCVLVDILDSVLCVPRVPTFRMLIGLVCGQFIKFKVG